MSLYGKTPYIKTLVSGMSNSNKSTLKGLLDNNSSVTKYSILGDADQLVIGSSASGAKWVEMRLTPSETVKGIMIYEADENCVIITYSPNCSQCLGIVEIDIDTLRSYKVINEPLTIDEFRRVVDEAINEESGTKVFSNIEVEGTAKFGDSVDFNDAEITNFTYCTTQTTAPTAAITDGGIHIVYLSTEPATKYSGYIYLIDEE